LRDAEAYSLQRTADSVQVDNANPGIKKRR